MKKLFALLLACSMITCAFTGCGSEDEGKTNGNSSSSAVSDELDSESSEDSDSESSEESDSVKAEVSVSESDSESSESIDSESSSNSDSESSEDSNSESESDSSSEENNEPAAVVAGKAGDANLVGVWSNDELAMVMSSIRFKDNGIISTFVDYSTIMNISNGKLSMSGIECDYEFDGTDFSCAISSADMGIEDSGSQVETMSIIEMSKLESGSANDVNGTYLLTGGLIYESMEQNIPVDGDTYVLVDGSNLYIDVEICGYNANGSEIEFTGDSAFLFGEDGDSSSKCKYKVDGDTLVITSAIGEEETLTRNTNIK
ncbi:MAG: hypothetical protein K2G63_02655 [Oscillospiraceae bacterium]|nr:hypothetical protein [Oscillospiraceae bacterium]